MQDREGRTAKLRSLPSVQLLLETPEAAALGLEFARPRVAEAIRAVLDQLRVQVRDGSVTALPEAAALLARAQAHLAERGQPVLRPVINATGIVLHTNLGRAPLAPEAAAAASAVAAGYANLEFDLDSGRRGARTEAVERLLRALTGAEAALAVNNGAASVLLALAGLAGTGEVVVSRGELVEIGGGFRIPDVIRQGGARLVEVGSTNRTRLADYRAAITPETRLLLKVHQSNFRMVGFTEETGIAALSGLARAHGLLLVADLGSGRVSGPGDEPTLREAVAAGADLITCSGDKLLGGPQAGLLLGREAAVDRLRRHPLLRALRLDKMSLAALEATLLLHLDAPERIPVLQMLAQGEAALQARAERLRALLGGDAEIVPSEGFAGGGALPGQAIPSRAVRLAPGRGAEALARKLRAGRPALVGRIVADRVLLDMLTLRDDELDAVAAAVRAA